MEIVRDFIDKRLEDGFGRLTNCQREAKIRTRKMPYLTRQKVPYDLLAMNWTYETFEDVSLETRNLTEKL